MKKFPFRHVLLAGIFSFILAACHKAQDNNEYASADGSPQSSALVASDANSGDDKRINIGGSQFDYQVDASAPANSQTVITANVDFETSNVRQTVAAIEGLVGKHSGVMAFSEIKARTGLSKDYKQADGNTLKVQPYSHSARMQMRIPRNQVSAFLRDIQQHVVFLDKQVFRAEDIILDLRRKEMEAMRLLPARVERDAQDRHQFQDQIRSASGFASSMMQSLTASDVPAADEPMVLDASGVLVPMASQAKNPPPTHQTTAPVLDKKEQADYARIQQEYWKNRIEFAVITLNLRQPERIFKQVVETADAVAEENKLGFGAMLAPMVKQGWSGFAGVVLFFIGIWPLALGVPLLWLVWKRWQQSGREDEYLPNKNDEAPTNPFDDDEDDGRLP